jgi:hypothetical protein
MAGGAESTATMRSPTAAATQLPQHVEQVVRGPDADRLPIGSTGRLDLQRLAGPVGQPSAIGADGELVEVLDLDRARALSAVVADQPGCRATVARADQGLAQLGGVRHVPPYHAAGDGPERVVAPGYHGERHDPLGQPGDVETGGRGDPCGTFGICWTTIQVGANGDGVVASSGTR